MHATHVSGITIRPLRNGDAATVVALFDRLGEGARASRFCGAKPRLTDAELDQLSRVDGNRHVLVAYVAVTLGRPVSHGSSGTAGAPRSP